jgi:hypothetical protein
LPPDRNPHDLPDDLRLTQYGERPPLGLGFRDRLREEIGETETSLILGEVDASAASMLVAKYLSAFAMRRLTSVGELRRAGFQVVHSPSKANRLHVSVFPPVLATGERAEWDDELAVQFNACFTEDSGGEVTTHDRATDDRQPGLGARARDRER